MREVADKVPTTLAQLNISQEKYQGDQEESGGNEKNDHRIPEGTWIIRMINMTKRGLMENEKL